MGQAYKAILVVEDDHFIRNALLEALELEGYKVLTAANGKEALDLLNTPKKPSLIFLDIEMPVMDGRQLLSAIRSDVVLASIPVVVVSGTAEPHHVPTANQCIRKPFNLDHMLSIAAKYAS